MYISPSCQGCKYECEFTFVPPEVAIEMSVKCSIDEVIILNVEENIKKSGGRPGIGVYIRHEETSWKT